MMTNHFTFTVTMEAVDSLLIERDKAARFGLPLPTSYRDRARLALTTAQNLLDSLKKELLGEEPPEGVEQERDRLRVELARVKQALQALNNEARLSSSGPKPYAWNPEKQRLDWSGKQSSDTEKLTDGEVLDRAWAIANWFNLSPDDIQQIAALVRDPFHAASESGRGTVGRAHQGVSEH